jgi:hypothetical protein
MPEAPVKKTAQRQGLRIKKRTLRRASRLGCLPAAVIGPLAIVGLLIVRFYRQAPFWVASPQQYLFEKRFTAGLVVLIVCQVFAHWLLGLMAASGGASAIGEHCNPRPRLIVIRRRLLIPMLALFALRLMVLFWVVGAGVVVYRSALVLPDSIRTREAFVRLDRTTLILMLGVMAVFAAYWLAGPFLRVRGSTALGALGAALAPDRKSRRWMAVSARLGLGLAQLLLVTWGLGLAILILVTLSSPRYTSMQPVIALGNMWPGWWTYWQYPLSYLALGAGIVLVAGLQIVMAWVYRWAAPLALRLRRGAGS